MITEKIKVRVGFFKEKEVEIIKPEFFVNTVKLAESQSELAKPKMVKRLILLVLTQIKHF